MATPEEYLLENLKRTISTVRGVREEFDEVTQQLINLRGRVDSIYKRYIDVLEDVKEYFSKVGV